jgi:hypothetical protein
MRPDRSRLDKSGPTYLTLTRSDYFENRLNFPYVSHMFARKHLHVAPPNCRQTSDRYIHFEGD